MAVTEQGLFGQVPGQGKALALEPAIEAHEKRLEELLKQSKKLVDAASAWCKACRLGASTGLPSGAQVEDAERSLVQARRCQTGLKAALRACRTGDVVSMEKATNAAIEVDTPLSPLVAQAEESWDFNVDQYLAEGHWLVEVKAIAADRHGIHVRIDGGELICAPISLVARPQSRRLAAGKKIWSSMRPTVIARELEKARSRLREAKSQEFLESLYAAWKVRSNHDLPVLKFREAYATYCLAPGWKKDNSPAAYAESILALAKSGIPATKDGTRFQYERPGEKAKTADVIAVRDEDGREIRYVGIRFIGS